VTDVENSWAKSREEADAFRALTTGGLGELLDSHRHLKADEDRAVRGHVEKTNALETETQSLRMVLRESRQQLEDSQGKLLEERKKGREADSERNALATQLVAVKNQLATALTDAAKLKKDISERDSQIRDKAKELGESSAKLSMLRGYLQDHGVVVDENKVRSNGSDSTVSELENQLAEKTRQHEATERELVQASKRKREVEVQLAQLSNEVELIRAGQSGGGDSDKARELEEKLAEQESAHQKRLQQMEDDYQLAVHYVKCVSSPLSFLLY